MQCGGKLASVSSFFSCFAVKIARMFLAGGNYDQAWGVGKSLKSQTSYYLLVGAGGGVYSFCAWP